MVPSHIGGEGTSEPLGEERKGMNVLEGLCGWHTLLILQVLLFDAKVKMTFPPDSMCTVKYSFMLSGSLHSEAMNLGHCTGVIISP